MTSSSSGRVLFAGLLPFPEVTAASSRLVSLAKAVNQTGWSATLLMWAPTNRDEASITEEKEVGQTTYEGLPVYFLEKKPRSGRGFFYLEKGKLLKQLGKKVALLVNTLSFDTVVLYDQDLRLLRTVLHEIDKPTKVIQQFAERQQMSDFRWGVLNPNYWMQRRHLLRAPSLCDGTIVISRALGYACKRPERPASLHIPALLSPRSRQFAGIKPMQDRTRCTLRVGYLVAGAKRDGLNDLFSTALGLRKQGKGVELSYAGLAVKELGDWQRRSRHANAAAWFCVFGRLQETDLIEYINGLDALVFLRKDDSSGVAAFPTRLPEFLLTGRPVICSRIGDIPVFVPDDAIVYCAPGDNRDLKRAIGDLMDSQELIERIGTYGRAIAQRAFGWEGYGEAIVEYIKTCHINRK